MQYAQSLWNFLNKVKSTTGTPLQFLLDSTKATLLSAPKFNLPKGGTLMDDPLRRGLSPETSLALPFDSVVLQFKPVDTLVGFSRVVIIVRKDLRGTPAHLEENSQWVSRHSPLSVACWGYSTASRVWLPVSTFLLPTISWCTGVTPEGILTYRVLPFNTPSLGITPSHTLKKLLNTQHPVLPYGVQLVLDMLSVLSCSNVSCVITKTATPKKGRPLSVFSELCVLSITTEPKKTEFAGCPIVYRKPPADTVYKGHIRAYEDGSALWVNATSSKNMH